MNSGAIFLGVVVGAAAGTLAGILLAPEKGEKTRKQLLEKGEDYLDSLKDKAVGMVDNLSKKYEVLKDGLEDVATKVKAK